LKPQTSAFLDKSQGLLAQADTMLKVGLNDAAGRMAYLAELHAAQALIFETAGGTFKGHATVQRGFGWLVGNEPRVDANLRALLGRIYNLKAIADYETGPGSHVSAEGAGAASRIRAALRGVHHNSYPAEPVGTCARTGLRRGPIYPSQRRSSVL
jgi:uncharacterized protein (UPF0332 family)